jgi:hypothetical protein
MYGLDILPGENDENIMLYTSSSGEGKQIDILLYLIEKYK